MTNAMSTPDRRRFQELFHSASRNDRLQGEVTQLTQELALVTRERDNLLAVLAENQQPQTVINHITVEATHDLSEEELQAAVFNYKKTKAYQAAHPTDK